MIKSMTGFGKSTFTCEGKSVVIEIRTLNSKQLDLSTKCSNIFKEKENEIRSLVTQQLERGKIDVVIYIEKNEQASLTIDKQLAKTYFDELTALSKEVGNPVESDIFCQVLRIPDVMKTANDMLSENLWEQLHTALLATCDQVNQYRTSEGAALAIDLEKRVRLINSFVDKIVPFEQPRIDRLREKFTAALNDLNVPGGFDSNRLEQELIFYIEKLDITEEKVRLKKHCQYFLETMRENQSNGKKLGFIVQEMGRETNTIGSKCNDSDIQQIVVQMKDEVEKIKEQLANIL
ncbi:MAG: YicC family protein [Bacteroidales bacterium]|nr:YicC family protein [Bacteroidales bacterium]